MTPLVDAHTSTRHRWYQGADGVVFERPRKARKRHDCAVCVAEIEPGEQYLAVWSPGWFRAALHVGCADFVDQLHAEMDLRDDEGIPYDEAADLAEEHGYTFDPAARTWSNTDA